MSCLSSGSSVSKKRVSNSPVVTAFLFCSGAPPPRFPMAFLLPGWPPLRFATLRFGFCNVAFALLSQPYLFFQLLTVPSGTPRASEISISFLPDKNSSFACSALASGALAKPHHLSIVFVFGYRKRDSRSYLLSLFFFIHILLAFLLFMFLLLYFIPILYILYLCIQIVNPISNNHNRTNHYAKNG